MGKGYNPYRAAGGRFGSGPSKRRIQYASSDEWNDMNDDEDLKESQIQKSSDEAKKLAEEEAKKDRDKEINQLRNEIEHFKERAAGARDTDTRRTYEKMAKDYTKRLKKLTGEN